ncbi:hypothetical protein [Phenylobacterium sp.]|uniref:hypothetical protein n=1 Tax=Phenylobacterium sp. TaxID=1871053 RepID=UPI0035B01775
MGVVIRMPKPAASTSAPRLRAEVNWRLMLVLAANVAAWALMFGGFAALCGGGK